MKGLTKVTLLTVKFSLLNTFPEARLGCPSEGPEEKRENSITYSGGTHDPFFIKILALIF